MRKNLYFLTAHDDICHHELYFRQIMRDEGLTEIEVFKAEPFKIKGIFWCSEHGFCGDGSENYCGKVNDCKQYQPRNGKSGCCVFHSSILYEHGDKVTLKLKA